MEKMNIFLNVSAWLVAIISLIISVIALRISKRVMVLGSRDYVPLMDVNISEDNELSIDNKDSDLFHIIQGGHIRVDIFGFDDIGRSEAIRIPLVSHSRLRKDFEIPDKIVLNRENAHACAYFCSMPEKEIVAIDERVHRCKVENPNWQNLPPHRSVIHYVQILYLNKFHEQKAYYIKKKHYHGSGYHQTSITETDFQRAIENIAISEKLSGEELWQYLIKRFRHRFDFSHPYS